MSFLIKTPVSTPKKSPAAPAQDSPGTWHHPRLAEITRRQNATTFSDKHVRRIAWNIAVIATLVAARTVAGRYSPMPSPDIKTVLTWTYNMLLFIPTLNILLACLPLVRSKDDLSDIALTPGQRKLLGLAPSSAPPTPGSVYSTPPRYSRTPSMSGSAGSKRSFSNSHTPSAYRTSIEGNGNLAGIGSPFSPAGSPLVQKALNGARRTSLGSLGSPSPLGAKNFGVSTATSIFNSGPESPSPSPANGKRSSVGLNNKWLYERGRKSSGNTWA